MSDFFDIGMAVEGWQGDCQDYVNFIPLGEQVVVVVADGAGGTAGGHEAAEEVLGAVFECAVGQQTVGELNSPMTWCEILRSVDRDLADRASGHTTCVVAWMNESEIVGASVGDSEAWLIGSDGPAVLTSSQQRKPLIGDGGTIPVPFSAKHSGRLLILGSDGLFKYAPRSRLLEATEGASLHQIVADLLAATRLPTGGLQDDVGIIACRPKNRVGLHSQS